MKTLFNTACLLAVALCPASVPASAQAIGESHQAVRSAEDELKMAEADVNDCEALVESKQDALFKASGLIAGTPETVRQLADHLQAQKEAMDVEEAGAKGRQDAIAKAIAQTTDQIRSRGAGDDVTTELEKVVAARQKQLERLKQLHAAAAVSNVDVDAAEEALWTARAEAAASKMKMSGPSTDLLEALNRELINLTISRQERATKLEFIHSRLKELAPALGEARALEKALHQLERAERRRDAAMDRFLSARRQLGGN